MTVIRDGQNYSIDMLSVVGYVLTSNNVHFVSLADNFTVQFSNLLNSHMEFKEDSLTGLLITGSFVNGTLGPVSRKTR